MSSVLADFVSSLPICARAPNTLTVAEARSKWWLPGNRLAVHGHLAVIAWGPPCEGTARPTSGAPCARAWTLWDAARRGVTLPDHSPTDVGALTLTSDTPARAGGFSFPALTEGAEVGAGMPPPDIEVAVIGEVPLELCESNGDELVPDPELRGATIRCATISFDVHPLTVTKICRTLGAPPPATATEIRSDGGAR